MLTTAIPVAGLSRFEKVIAPSFLWHYEPVDGSFETCGVCIRGIVSLDATFVATAQTKEHRRPYAFRCLCPLGDRVSHRVAPIDHAVTKEGMYALWPGGPPISETPAAMMERAGIPRACWTWTIDSYRKHFGSTKETKTYVKAAAAWLASKANERSDIVIYGPSGTGKTGIAIGMALALVERRERILFTEAKYLFMRWRDTFNPERQQTEMAFFDEMVSYGVLVIDEADKGTNAAETGGSFTETGLQLLIDRRQKANRPTVLTLNLATSIDGHDAAHAIAALLGAPTYDRLRERAQIWPILGRSKRRTHGAPLPLDATEKPRAD